MDDVDLRTGRLALRRWRDSDRERFAALNADPDVMRHFPSVLTRQQSDAMIGRIHTHFAEHGYGLWAVDVDGQLAGFAGLAWSHVTGERALEVGWRFAPAFWGRGYATEAAQAALDVGLRQVPEVVSFTAVVNEPSVRVMQRLGMRRVREFERVRADLPERLRRHVLYAAP